MTEPNEVRRRSRLGREWPAVLIGTVIVAVTVSAPIPDFTIHTKLLNECIEYYVIVTSYGSSRTFVTPSSRLSKRSYISGAFESGSRWET